MLGQDDEQNIPSNLSRVENYSWPENKKEGLFICLIASCLKKEMTSRLKWVS